MLDLEKIKAELLKGKLLEEVLEKFEWKEFEDFVAKIFQANDFKTIKNFRFQARKKRHEIDLIAFKKNFAICVDCKRWSKHRYKKFGLKKAAKELENRISSLKKFSFLEIKPKKFLPLIITLYQEDVLKEGKTFFVPVWKLNSFLLENF